MTTMEFNTKLISLEDNLERFALSLTSNREEAKDLLQETYLKAFKSLRNGEIINKEKLTGYAKKHGYERE